ncbi:1-acyl-sn-glycerol-3-phosphate acyltransferase [Chitinivorax tropicus]|uniref:1-acyl-sn-glycerol-3-phosphate acyltransferase n=1 Tax=Chitinivorax tropicus TaxID=714531 RepID=A0A840MIJ7_9PROT|nr:lysophospholipid acyltransferase family protein [Chitinivorax tropicus]MBB5019034.1 1-acyl-sn-glycerol-3-phosphate acyltransferase [Chitinivorax tropicus]
MKVWLRSLLFLLILLIITPIFALIALLVLPLPPLRRYRIVTGWSRLYTWFGVHLCGVRYRVEGLENLPDTPCIIYSKHQSAWETVVFQAIFPPQVWVAKRELAWVPFFGWGLATLSPILINRSDRRKANQQLIDQGRDRLAKGFWIVIFPEGSRVPAGKQREFKHGGARLAHDLNVPILPVALNSGEFWPKNSLWRFPGEITVSIGPAIHPAGHTIQSLTNAGQGWINHEMPRISGIGPCHPRNQSNLANTPSRATVD